jgi:hypothetical protein
MFNLEQAITEWRRRMTAGGIKAPVPLDELESHLREEIERQMKAGLNETEALEISIQKIGQARTLQNEFKKVDAASEERAWKLKQRLGMISVSLVSAGMGCEVLFKPGALSQMNSGQQLSSLAAIATFTLLTWAGRLGYRLFPAIRVKRIRGVVLCSVAVPVMVWWIVFLNIVAPHYDFNVGQFFLALLWAFLTPAGILAGFALGIEIAAQKKVALADS